LFSECNFFKKDFYFIRVFFTSMDHNYWLKQDFDKLDDAKTFADVGDVAVGVLKRLPNMLGQVCGPISTGGYGSIDKNLKAFTGTISKLISEENSLFVQIPLEDAIFRIKSTMGDKYDPLELLEKIYAPIFNSKKISKLFFIFGWESSFGARWEHDFAKKAGIQIIYLPKDYVLV